MTLSTLFARRPGRRIAAAAIVACAFLAAQPALAAPAPPDLSGFWESRGQASRPPAPPPKLTPQAIRTNELGRAEMDATGGLDEQDFYCVAAGMPWIMFQSAPIDIIQTPGEVGITQEGASFPRHIYLDGRAHPQAPARDFTINGHSIGHWEGDTLVVDTVSFSPRGGHGPVGFTLRTTDLHLVERFRLRTPDELEGKIRVEDPSIFLEPYEYTFIWYRSDPGAYAQETSCDPRDYQELARERAKAKRAAP